MKVFIVYAHPEPTSFNGALRDAALATVREDGHEVAMTDLYAESFDPRAGRHDFLEARDPRRFDYQAEQEHAANGAGYAETIEREHQRLFWCDLLILQFPLWWFGPPAILKGWIDRVLTYRRMYDMRNRFGNGVLKGRRGLLSVTTGGTVERFSTGGLYGEIDPFLRPLQFGVLEYVGLEALDPFVSYAASRASPEELARQLEAWRRRLREIAGGAQSAAAAPRAAG